MNEPAPNSAPRAKRSPLFWTCGGCAFLGVAWMVGLVIGVVIVALRSHAPEAAQQKQEETEEAHWETFRNTKAGLTANLQAQFVGFTFRYPKDRFTLAPSTINFTTAERADPQNPKAAFPLEGLYIGVSATFLGNNPPPESDYPRELKSFSEMISSGETSSRYEQFRPLEEKECTIDGVKARQLTFQGVFTREDQTKAPLLGKIIVVRRPEARSGVVLLLTADAAKMGFTSAEDVGVKGDLGKILQTFHFEH